MSLKDVARHDAAQLDQSQEHFGGDRVLLRTRRVVAGGRPDESAVPVDARAAFVGLGTGRFEPQTGRLRSSRRAHFALRPDLPDRDAGRYQHRLDFQLGDLRRRRRIRLPGHALSRGQKGQADGRDRLAAGGRGVGCLRGAGRHGSGRWQAGGRCQLDRPAPGRLRDRAAGPGQLHRRGAEPDGRRLGRFDSLPGT